MTMNRSTKKKGHLSGKKKKKVQLLGLCRVQIPSCGTKQRCILHDLRASKRQKEKVESEEVFKKKMLEEEDALNKMAQDVFDTFENFDDFRRGTPWYTPVNAGIDEDSLELFWEYFDMKISELNIHFTWNFDLLKAK